MSLLLQVIVNGLIAGSIYALVSCGFSLIYNTNRFMHFAHGVSVLVSGYILFTLFTLLNFNFYFALISSLVYSSFIGFLIFRIVYLPLQNRKASNVILLIASISLLLLFQNLLQMIYGANVKDIGFTDIKIGYEIGDVIITQNQIIILIISIILFVSLFLFMNKTKLGKNMRAVSENKELASIVVINSKKVSDLSFFIGSFLGGIAGVLISLEQNVTPYMGTMLTIKGFTSSIIGGIFSVPGSILGSYILGLAENLGILYLPSGYKDAISFVLLFLFLLLKPNGLFSSKRRVN